MKAVQVIKSFCKKEGFNFVDCDKENMKVPCSLDKKYIEDNQTIFISGFYEGSKRIIISKGGLKMSIELKTPIDLITELRWLKNNLLPSKFVCGKCGKKNLNLRTQDNHKTYDCPDCQKEKHSSKAEDKPE